MEGWNERKRGVLVIADFLYVMGDLVWGGILSLMALWWSMTEQEDFDSRTLCISAEPKHALRSQWEKRGRTKIRPCLSRFHVYVGWVFLRWHIKFGGSLMKHDRAGRLRLRNFFHFNEEKNNRKMRERLSEKLYTRTLFGKRMDDLMLVWGQSFEKCSDRNQYSSPHIVLSTKYCSQNHNSNCIRMQWILGKFFCTYIDSLLWQASFKLVGNHIKDGFGKLCIMLMNQSRNEDPENMFCCAK